jgi:diphosphomevalonate decarboxylase
VAVTELGEKSVGSTDGMLHTEETSPYYDAWLDVVERDLERAEEAVEARDFDALRGVTESNCLRMHASAMAADPELVYWNPVTLRIIERLRQVRQDGELNQTMFTIDAGPHVKVFCPSSEADGVADWLGDIDGVQQILRTGVGAGARIVE